MMQSGPPARWRCAPWAQGDLETLLVMGGLGGGGRNLESTILLRRQETGSL